MFGLVRCAKSATFVTDTQRQALRWNLEVSQKPGLTRINHTKPQSNKTKYYPSLAPNEPKHPVLKPPQSL